MEHQIPDEGGRMVSASGELIAEVTTRTPGKPRWSEFRLIRLTRGGYLLSIVGRSAVPGEIDRPKMRIAETPEAVARALQREVRRGVFELSGPARDLLEQAAARDPALQLPY